MQIKDISEGGQKWCFSHRKSCKTNIQNPIYVCEI